MEEESAQRSPRSVLYKVLLVGDVGSGKTSIIKNYVHGIFSSNYKSTIGVDFALKVLKGDNKVIRLQLWDIAGQERYGQMTRVYYKDAVAAFIVFDVMRPITFEAVKKWKLDIDSKFGERKLPVFLLANKVDLVQKEDDWHERKKEMDKFCKEHEFVDWFETSAKTAFGIDPAFENMISVLQNLYSMERKMEDASLIRLSPIEEREGEIEKKECCFL